MGYEKLKLENGACELIKYLDSLYHEDAFVVLYEAYKAMEGYKRTKSDSLEKYIAEFKERCLNTEKKGMAYPNIIKAFKMLEGSCISESQRLVIVSAVKYDNTNSSTLFEDVESQMKKIVGEVSALGKHRSDKPDVKDIDAFVAENAEAFAYADFGKVQNKERR